VSAFLIVFDRKGKPLEKKLLTPMLDRLSHRGPDGSDYFLQKNILISHHHLWITPEGYGEKQPIQKGSYYITFDGRLDNREELYDLLDFNIKDLRNISDANLCILLYEKYKEKSFDKIIGSYSFIIVDLNKNLIVGARDPMAERGFYYYISDNLFIAASEETAILSHPDISLKINEVTLCHYFALEPVFDGSTFFEDIHDLHPGHYLSVSQYKFFIRKFWEFTPQKIRYKKDSQIVDHFKELLEKSVISRMRCVTPVSVMLSGGIDSNSLAAIAAINNNHQDKVRAISWTFNDLKECDERKYIDPVCEMYGLEKIQFNADQYWPLKCGNQYFRNPNTPLENIYRNLKQKAYQLCNQNNSRVIFNGWYADTYYAGNEFWLIDQIKDLQVGSFISSLFWIINNSGFFKIHRDPAFRKIFRFLRSSKRKEISKNKYHWLTDQAKYKIHSQNEIKMEFNTFDNPTKAYNMLSNISYFSPSYEQFNLSSYCLELECPYTDVRLVNFMINIPSYFNYSNGIKKIIAKKSFKTLLPPKITSRNDNTSLTPLYIKGIRNKEITNVTNTLLSNNEWQRFVRKEWLKNILSSNMENEKYEVIIWKCISYIHWLDRLKTNNI